MNIILLRRRGHGGMVTVSVGRALVASLSALIVLPAAFMFAGYYLGLAHMRANPDDIAAVLQAELDAQRVEVEEAKRVAEENMNALALRLGQMQAHVMRLDALGQRLTKIANLDNGEFDFENAPGQGGPLGGSISSQTLDVPDFLKTLDELSAQLDDREQQLELVEEMLMTRSLQAEVMPAGRPVTSGWLSSYFGKRTDPFTGHRAHHAGVDFAGKEGSEVVAVAAGVVTWSGKRYGYGNMVEINHGNGYATRYGHNKENLVKVGETVKKGQVVAKMGSTGRSTGPHVHFEVLYNDKAVNPSKYLRAAR